MRSVRILLPAIVLALFALPGCSSDSGDADAGFQADTVADVPAISCLGAVCSTAAECGALGPCVLSVACNQGCCEYQYEEQGAECSEGCNVDGTCSGTANCEGTSLLVCEEEDGNPCTAPWCDPDAGECSPEEKAIEDGAAPFQSNCWEGIVCTGGEPDESDAAPTQLNLDCQAQNDALDPFGCVEQVVCVDSETECSLVLKDEGTECWTDSDSNDIQCTGHSCSAQGDCVVDDAFSAECGDDSWPDECDEACRGCTELTCHWIPDPAAGEDAGKKVKYCMPKALPGDECSDGSDCTYNDVCVMGPAKDGPLGKETLGECQAGEGQTKEDCLAELGFSPLACLLAGVGCDEAEGCQMDQEAADQWCQPPAAICFDQDLTYCSHLDIGDGKWDSETGCHLVLFEGGDCDDGNPCTEDVCDGGCVNTPADGLACDDGDPGTENDVCKAGVCVGDPTCDPVDGGWTDWVWSECSVTCGGGVKTATRSCTNPPPSCGGPPCDGPSTDLQACNTQLCVEYLPLGTTVYSLGEQVVTGVVPSGKNSIQFKLWGGGGGGGYPGRGGGGAHVAGTLTVQPGDDIEIRVAGGGVAQCGGGGGTYVFKNGQVVMVAGGGGGAGSDGCSGCVGDVFTGAGGGGGPLAGAGQDGTDNNKYDTNSGGGGGAAQGWGGGGGISNNQSQYDNCTMNGEQGSANTGGKSTKSQCDWAAAATFHMAGNQSGGNGTGGGGGAGHYGGGSGASMWTYTGGGGGGGSSNVQGSVGNTSSDGGNYQTPGGTGVPGYQGNAGQGGASGLDAGQPQPGKPGLVVMFL